VARARKRLDDRPADCPGAAGYERDPLHPGRLSKRARRHGICIQ
jgi:hypothetical protein